MFSDVAIIMGVVALIQCQPLDLNTTTVRSYVTPSDDHNNGSQTQIDLSKSALEVVNSTFNDTKNSWNRQLSDTSSGLNESRTAIDGGRSRTKRAAIAATFMGLLLAGLLAIATKKAVDAFPK